MPRLKPGQTPKLRKHVNGQGVVRLNGRDFYLGPFGHKDTEAAYEKLIGSWLLTGRAFVEEKPVITVLELVAAYIRHARKYYLDREGKPTDQVAVIQSAVRALTPIYGATPVDSFGPLALQIVREKWIEAGWSRTYCNDSLAVVKRMFKWGTAQQLVPPGIFQSLEAVDGLRRGRSAARESPPILPVDDRTVDATILKLPEVVADMVRLQRLTWMRPAEICLMRPCDIDRTGDVWLYRPQYHKTDHHNIARLVALGPQAQAVLTKYLLRPEDSYCFRPCDSEKRRRQEQHRKRKAPLNCGNRPGSAFTPNRKRPPGAMYTPDSYRRAIHRACDVAFPSPTKLEGDDLAEWQSKHRWSPNRLRHSAATKIRAQFGLEAAQVALGHTNANITQTYAERDMQKAIEVARRIG